MTLLSRRAPRARRIDAPSGMRVVLHVGCGPRDHRSLPDVFPRSEWHEVRLDVDPGVSPDVVASITDMSPVADASVDAVYSHHNIEHVFAHEVPLALAEFLRVLRPGGEVLIGTPDLEALGRVLAAGRLEDTIIRAPAGAISALDVVYGLRSDIEGGREYMAHRTGFTPRTLGRRLHQAGFAQVQVAKPEPYAMLVRARRPGG